MCLPRVKSKLDLEDQEVPVAQYCSPQRSFREKITDFFYSSEEAAEEDREGSVSPTMPVLLPQVAAFFHRDPSACPLAPATCLLARGGRDLLIENEARQGKKWTEKWETRRNARREMGKKWEMRWNSRREMGIK